MKCFLLLVIIIMQLDQEIDLILDKKDVIQAIEDWCSKWVPAVLEYGYTLAGKKAQLVLSTVEIWCSYTLLCKNRNIF